jgi:hypothetical protein
MILVKPILANQCSYNSINITYGKMDFPLKNKKYQNKTLKNFNA